MRKFEFWKLGLQNVLASSLRSALTVLGMAIGVAAILAVETLGEAGRVQVKSEIARLGIDRVQVTAADSAHALSQKDAEYLRHQLQTDIDEVVLLEAMLSTTNHTLIAPMIGCTDAYLKRMSPELLAGEWLAFEWPFQKGTEALVGQRLAESLQIRVGDWFSFGGMMLRCKGVMGSCQQASQMDTKDAVVVSLSALEPWLGEAIHELSVGVPDGTSPDEVARQAEKLLLNRRLFPVEAVSLQVQADAADSVLLVFVDVLKWVALICMLVSGIGIANILLVSVRERRREIGVMQSLGATQMQICGLFLCEALIYAFAGGILGLLLGGVLIAVAGGSIGLTPVVNAGDCTAVFLAAVFLGLLAGGAPAAGASMMKPVDALRDD